MGRKPAAQENSRAERRLLQEHRVQERGAFPAFRQPLGPASPQLSGNEDGAPANDDARWRVREAQASLVIGADSPVACVV